MPSLLQKTTILLALALSSASCFAGLTYTSKTLDVHPAQETNVTAQFTFFNTGKTPVEIKSVKTSCSCTTASSNKKFCAPGTEGKINVVYQSNGKPGPIQKQILVLTDDTTNPIDILNLRILIPQPVTLAPPSLIWILHEASKPKVIEVHVNDSNPKASNSTAVLHVVSANPGISASLKAVTPYKEYEISVLPRNTEQPLKATLIIETNLTGLKKYLTADASVILPKPPPRPSPSR